MQTKLENLIKVVYKNWKSEQPKLDKDHPDEETLVSFTQGKLSAKEDEKVRAHLINCDLCAEVFMIQARLKAIEEKEVPLELLERIKRLLSQTEPSPALEIFLKAKEKVLELINTTGDVLLGQELVSAPILRSRQVNNFKDEITILKDFKEIRVEIKIENKDGNFFDLLVVAKEKQSLRILKDVRMILLKDDLELESYLADSGRVVFEHVLLGKYTIEISSVENKLASILLEIRK